MSDHEPDNMPDEPDVTLPDEPAPTQEPTPEPEPDVPLPEPEPEPEAEPQEPSSFARMEEIGRKLDGLQKHVAKRLGEILGDDVALFEECEVCSYSNTPGWRPRGPYPVEVANTVMAVLGRADEAEYKADEHSQTCAECGGYGQVASGSKVQGQDLLPCVRCDSRGWTPTDEKRQSPWQLAANGAAPPPSPVADLAPAAPELSPEDAAEVAALKEKGYTVIAPFVPAG